MKILTQNEVKTKGRRNTRKKEKLLKWIYANRLVLLLLLFRRINTILRAGIMLLVVLLLFFYLFLTSQRLDNSSTPKSIPINARPYKAPWTTCGITNILNVSKNTLLIQSCLGTCKALLAQIALMHDLMKFNKIATRFIKSSSFSGKKINFSFFANKAVNYVNYQG